MLCGTACFFCVFLVGWLILIICLIKTLLIKFANMQKLAKSFFVNKIGINEERLKVMLENLFTDTVPSKQGSTEDLNRYFNLKTTEWNGPAYKYW